MGAMALFWNEHVYSYASGNFFEAAQEVCERKTPEIVKPDLDCLSERCWGEPYSKRELVCISALVVVERWHSSGDPSARA